jgi:hypothetical protein
MECVRVKSSDPGKTFLPYIRAPTTLESLLAALAEFKKEKEALARQRTLGLRVASTRNFTVYVDGQWRSIKPHIFLLGDNRSPTRL